ncbi:MAG TPA: F0F1 ATP synthase subunit epsilon [Candidatus Saccharimonadales bacterium]|nr:F0F1 ATP synthase subunit epsilon [Candidatus Saccharimonadales bacterium]
MSDGPVQPGGVDDQKVIGRDEPVAVVTRSESEQRKALEDFNRTSAKSGMRVHIHSPYQNYYDGIAFSLSAESATGPFDILPHHHNFISLLPACEIVIRTVDQGERRIRISGGIIHVKANQVVVFLDV